MNTLLFWKYTTKLFQQHRKDLTKMPAINITRGTSATVLRRSAVIPGQVFAMRNRRTGKLGKNYAHIGTNGRMYSVNTATGELASSQNEGREVVLTGKFEYNVNRKPMPGVVRTCRRADVRSGEVFHAVGKDTLYAHMGHIDRALEGFLSVPLARTDNHAVTRDGNKHVQVIGTFSMDVTPVE